RIISMSNLLSGIGLPGAILSLVALSIPAKAAMPAHPGMINYVEGNASINGQPITAKDVGTAELNENQVLSTGAGKAEVLLTPGVFLRVGDNSVVRMISAHLTDTNVGLLRGEAMVEVGDVLKENHIGVLVNGATITLEKNGLYDFNIGLPNVRVYDG